jgi:hypothetical protein
LINTLYWAIGIAISGAVIGFISAQIIRAVAKLQEGKSAVIESGHTLILGWSNRVFPILSELAIANENVRKPRVVIFAQPPGLRWMPRFAPELQTLES